MPRRPDLAVGLGYLLLSVVGTEITDVNDDQRAGRCGLLFQSIQTPAQTMPRGHFSPSLATLQLLFKHGDPVG